MTFLERLRSLRPRHLLGLLLAAWAAGLVIAACQLQAWQQDISRVLIQLRADELLRASVRATDPIRPEWHRRRALALMAAVERLHEKAAWTVAMPASWFDPLPEQVAQRIDQAFGDIVVDTIRRELDARASAITGVPQDARNAQLQAQAGCSTPVTATAASETTGTLEDMPEYRALRQQLAQVSELDRALGALVTLRDPASARPEDLRMLVRYTLRAELSGAASRSLSLFHARAALPDAELEALARRLQAAVTCSVGKGVTALYRRWFDQNELLAVEDRLERLPPQQLFEPASSSNLTASVARLNTAAWLIDRQAALLAQGSQQWMRGPGLQLGPGQQALLEQISAIRLLGPRAAAQVQALAEARYARFHRRFAAQFQRAHAGLEWHAPTGRYALSPERLALRDGIARLLDAPFMQEPAPATAVRTSTVLGGASVQDSLDDLSALSRERRQFVRESLPVFPKDLQPAVTRYMDDRLAQLAFVHAARYVTDAIRTDSAFAGPLEIARARMAAVEAALVDGGTPGLASRTRERLDRELLVPLASAYPVQDTGAAGATLSEASAAQGGVAVGAGSAGPAFLGSRVISSAPVTTVTLDAPIPAIVAGAPGAPGAAAAAAPARDAAREPAGDATPAVLRGTPWAPVAP